MADGSGHVPIKQNREGLTDIQVFGWDEPRPEPDPRRRERALVMESMGGPVYGTLESELRMDVTDSEIAKRGREG